MNTKQEFLISLDDLRSRIKDACNRSNRATSEVELMAVTKTHPPQAVEWALEAGLQTIGENRVQEAAGKRPEVQGTTGYWELIGPLQSNKARLALETFDRIQTVDRPKLVRILERLCGEMGKEGYPVLLQANVGEDPAKSGCSVEEAEALAAAVMESEHLQLEGLMTIGEFSDDEAVVRGTFRRLRELRDRLEIACGLKLQVLSMGMTGDLEWAVEEGSTLIRVGTALFGTRAKYPPE
ncbi:MAG: YggS family pyridoxal phosphate-dependent enzyme [Puniceicoccaceae bacterium]